MNLCLAIRKKENWRANSNFNVEMKEGTSFVIRFIRFFRTSHILWIFPEEQSSIYSYFHPSDGVAVSTSHKYDFSHHSLRDPSTFVNPVYSISTELSSCFEILAISKNVKRFCLSHLPMWRNEEVPEDNAIP